MKKYNNKNFKNRYTKKYRKNYSKQFAKIGGTSKSDNNIIKIIFVTFNKDRKKKDDILFIKNNIVDEKFSLPFINNQKNEFKIQNILYNFKLKYKISLDNSHYDDFKILIELNTVIIFIKRNNENFFNVNDYLTTKKNYNVLSNLTDVNLSDIQLLNKVKEYKTILLGVINNLDENNLNFPFTHSLKNITIFILITIIFLIIIIK